MHRAAPARPARAGLPDDHKLFLQLISPVPAPPRVQRRHVKGWCLGHAAPKATSCPSDSIHPAAGTGLYQEAAPSSASSQGNSILQSQASTAGHGLCRRAAPQPHHSHQQTRAAQHPTQKHEGYSRARHSFSPAQSNGGLKPLSRAGYRAQAAAKEGAVSLHLPARTELGQR